MNFKRDFELAPQPQLRDRVYPKNTVDQARETMGAFKEYLKNARTVEWHHRPSRKLHGTIDHLGICMAP